MRERPVGVVENEFLYALREVIPFLKKIPDEIYFGLHTAEFYLPDVEISSLREELEQKLGHYVMTYNARVFNLDIPMEKHLCAHIKGAGLTEEQSTILDIYENKVKKQGVRLVVYQNPLEIIQPEQSELFIFYNKS